MTTPLIEAAILNDYQPGYADKFIDYHARKFAWTEQFTLRVTTDALRFLCLSALSPAGSAPTAERPIMVCSPIVDEIVDAIFLDSPLLLWLEREVFGVRLLHVPYYAHGETDPIITGLRYAFTVQLMRTAGYEIDWDIWPPQLPTDYMACIAGGGPVPCHMMALAESN
jgi:hypothetical protein